MLGSEGFELDGEEYTATLRFAADGTYEGVAYILPFVKLDVTGRCHYGAELPRERATEVWWSLTEQQRDVIHQRCLEDAMLSEQDSDEAWAAF